MEQVKQEPKGYLGAYVEKELRDKIHKEAKEQDMTVSQFVRRILRHAMSSPTAALNQEED